MGLGQVFAVGPLALDQVGDGIDAEAVDPAVEPERHDVEHLFLDRGIIEIEVGLMAVEPVPEVLAGDRVPGPVGGLGVSEDDPCSLIHLVGVAPDVVVSLGRGGVAPGFLKPGVLVGGMVDHEVGDDADAAGVGGLGECLEVGDGADRGMDLAEIGDVVAVVLQG